MGIQKYITCFESLGSAAPEASIASRFSIYVV